jgi:hypothetical protein
MRIGKISKQEGVRALLPELRLVEECASDSEASGLRVLLAALRALIEELGDVADDVAAEPALDVVVIDVTHSRARSRRVSWSRDHGG